MPLSLCPLPKMQFFDNNGNPAASYYLYTYQAGSTSVSKSTYQDPAGAAFNTDPVVLDASGRASIWLDGSYYMELWTGDKTDPANSLVWSQDVVASFPSTELPNYASNAAALAGGLAIGAFYRNNDYVCVVH